MDFIASSLSISAVSRVAIASAVNAVISIDFTLARVWALGIVARKSAMALGVGASGLSPRPSQNSFHADK